jgi:acetyltransferase-like isoleucine patch superfamily enzyme
MRRMNEIFLHGVRYFVWKFFFNFQSLGKKVAIDSGVDISNPEFAVIGNFVHLQKDTWLLFAPRKNYPLLKIGDYTDLGRRTFISCAQKIVIGKHVLIAPNVYISDHSHEYQNIKLPILNQDISGIKTVEIGDGTWIGTNAVILPGVTIGKNVVIGANSVVTKSIPDFSVAVGAPAKIIKRYHPKSRKWS